MKHAITFALLFSGSTLFAQGMIPGTTAKPERSTTTIEGIVSMGEPVPPTLQVRDADGAMRPLISYKAAVELLVVGFFSPRCENNTAQWNALRRLYDDFHGWHVTFLALSTNTDESLEDLQKALTDAHVPFLVARDENQNVARALKLSATPGIAIIDEWNHLRYRGPLHDAVQTGKHPKHTYVRHALEVLIGHTEPLDDPQPDGFVGCPIH